MCRENINSLWDIRLCSTNGQHYFSTHKVIWALHYTHGKKGFLLLFLDVSNTQKSVDEVLLQSLLRVVFVQTPVLFFDLVSILTSINILGMGSCIFLSSYYTSEDVFFPHKVFSQKSSYYYGDGHHLASSPCQVDLDSPGGTLCHGRLSYMCI